MGTASSTVNSILLLIVVGTIIYLLLLVLTVDASRRGKKVLNSLLAIKMKMKGAHRSLKREEKSLYYAVTPDLSCDYSSSTEREQDKAGDDK